MQTPRSLGALALLSLGLPSCSFDRARSGSLDAGTDAGDAGRRLVTLAESSSPGVLAVGASGTYFGRCSGGTGAVHRVALDGGAPTTLGSFPGCAVGLALQGSRIFVATSGPGAIVSVSLDGGPVETLVSGVGEPTGIAVDPASVYFSTEGGELVSVSVAGGGAVPLVADRKDLTAPVVDATGDEAVVYFGDRERGTIESIPASGGTPSLLTSSVGAVSALALGRTDVYFGSGYLLMRAPRAGGPAVPLGTAAGAELLGVAVDSESVYFSGYGSVWKTALTGGEVSLLAADQSEARAIAVDEASVYWTNESGARPEAGSAFGTVVKITPK